MKLMDIQDNSQVSEARREVAAIGRGLGMTETDLGRVSIVVTEIATNLLKHAGGGKLLCSSYEDHSGSGLEVIAFDSGPGIGDLSAAMRDGHSTAGSAGQGLGAIRRQSDVFEMVSWPGQGAAVLARVAQMKANGRNPANNPGNSWGAVCIPAPREEVCGDAWFAAEHEDMAFGMVADGLGHGPGAAAASMAVVRVVERHTDLAPQQLLDQVNAALRATRGAAVALFQLRGGRLSYSGIGNIAGTAFRSGGMSRMVSMNGTAGMGTPRTKAFDYEAGPGTLIVLHSDGIGTGWSLEKYPGLSQAHPSLIAAILFRDFNRGRDDATVLVMRVGSQ